MNKQRAAFILLLLLAIVVSAAVILAAADFAIPWWSVDGGGGSSSGGNYNVSGSIGQPDTGLMSGGDYVVQGGYWSLLDPGRQSPRPLAHANQYPHGNGHKHTWPIPHADSDPYSGSITHPNQHARPRCRYSALLANSCWQPLR